MDRYEEAIEILVEFEFLFKYTCPNCVHRYNEVKVVRCPMCGKKLTPVPGVVQMADGGFH